jgi:4-hydroxy-tetrahydrodipicolinate synthase
MLPPFYCKGVPEEGLFRFFSEVVQRVGDDRLRVYSITSRRCRRSRSHKLVERLMKAYPSDRRHDWRTTGHTKSMIDAFARMASTSSRATRSPDREPQGGRRAHQRHGEHQSRQDCRDLQEIRTPSEKLQSWINEVRGVMQGYVMIPALSTSSPTTRERWSVDAGSPAAHEPTRRPART